MGYSHYWYRPYGHEDRDAFRRLGTDALAIIRTASALGVEVAGWDGSGSPEFTEQHFSLNGLAPERCETFVWESRPSHPEWHSETGRPETDPVFGCCKTRQLPYDAILTAILIRAKVIYGDAVRVQSDGGWFEDWLPGRDLYARTFGELAPCPFERVSA